MDKKKKKDTITRLRATNATYSIHHLAVAMGGVGGGWKEKGGQIGRRAQEDRFEE